MPNELWQTREVAGFTTHTGRIAVLNHDNVDTDRIIPARYLSRVSKLGFGELVFKDVRGPGFVLDTPEAAGASILVVGANFGCGSSREHAVWALQQAGFIAIIARKDEDLPGYSDIFRQNAANCGLLLIELTSDLHGQVSLLATGTEISVDLPQQLVIASGEELPFDINAAMKNALVEGLDLIGTTLLYDAQISEYESKSQSYVPAGVVS